MLLLFGQPLVLEGHDDLGRDGGGDLDIRGIEPAGLPPAEEQMAHHLLARPQGHEEAGTDSLREDGPIPRIGRIEFHPRVTQEDRLPRLNPREDG